MTKVCFAHQLIVGIVLSIGGSMKCLKVCWLSIDTFISYRLVCVFEQKMLGTKVFLQLNACS